MTEELPERARRAFEAHDAYAATDRGDAYRLDTVSFDALVTATGTDDWALRYTLTVRAPTLDAAVEEPVGPNLQEGWRDTYELRLEDAPGSVRADVDLDDLHVDVEGEEVVATFVFAFGNAERAPAVAKALAEYTEGTYLEGVVPGYTYRDPVAGLLSQAQQGEGDGRGGPMPL
ncbi:DUF5813 family protein [Halomarina ordinaria]|uniref:DUF5813 family protein n=1 Tax=Halomarina ordinaria TaxID=3033939 RepID=A0ABD5UB49_9EURY|nr:DUF5813 family protein [Halomarina sp. PSRA2]